VDDIYCDYDTSKAIDGFTNFCGGTILNKQYDCNTGTCTEANVISSKKFIIEKRINIFISIIIY